VALDRMAISAQSKIIICRYNLYVEQKKLLLRQHALEIREEIILNVGIHGSIIGKMMTRIICFDHNNCYYSSDEPG